MTTTTQEERSAPASALFEMSLPQLGPMNCVLDRVCAGRRTCLTSASCTSSSWAWVSVSVCARTVSLPTRLHDDLGRADDVAARSSAPPISVTVGAVTRNSAPPWNSMPRSSPTVSSDTIETSSSDRPRWCTRSCAGRRSRRRPHRGRAVRRAFRAGTSGLLRRCWCGAGAAAARRRRRQQRALGRPEPLGVEAGPAGGPAEELGPRQHRHHRLGEHEDHDDVDQRREAEGEREARARCRPRGRRAPPRRGTTRSRRPGSCAGRATQPVSTATRRVLALADLVPDRSKYTMNESAVMPMATIRPAMPARLSRKPDLPAEQHHQAVGEDRATRSRLATVTRPRPR